MFAYFCVEDPLSRAVIRRLICELVGDIPLTELQPNQGGFGSMKAKFRDYCTLARHHFVFILTDLDSTECAPSLRAEWMDDVGLSDPLPEKMCFRIAEREVEAWLIADRDNLSRYLGVPIREFPEDQNLEDPKEFLLNCVRQHGDDISRFELLPEGVSRVGLGYNTYLSRFASEIWDFQNASCRNSSLSRAIQKISYARHIQS